MAIFNGYVGLPEGTQSQTNPATNGLFRAWFNAMQRKFKTLVEQSDGMNLPRIRFPSPPSGGWNTASTWYGEGKHVIGCQLLREIEFSHEHETFSNTNKHLLCHILSLFILKGGCRRSILGHNSG